MQKYIIQRLLLTIPTIILVTLFIFLLLRCSCQRSVIDLIIGEYGRNDPELRATLEKELGLTGQLLRPVLRLGRRLLVLGRRPTACSRATSASRCTAAGRCWGAAAPRARELRARPLGPVLSAIAISVPLGVLGGAAAGQVPGLRPAQRGDPADCRAGLLDRGADHHLRLDLVQLGAADQLQVPDGGPGSALQDHALAGADHRPDAERRTDPPGPHADAGGAAPGLHPHGARQGPQPDARCSTSTRCATR